MRWMLLTIAMLITTPAIAGDVVMFRDKGWPAPKAQVRVTNESGHVVGWVRNGTCIRFNATGKVFVEATENVESVVIGDTGMTYVRVVPKLGMAGDKVKLEIVDKAPGRCVSG